ncbi:MAG: hypothetical protein ACLGH3_05670 [Actinomycetota bacterium]
MAKSASPSEDDLRLLAEYRREHEELENQVLVALLELGLSATSRQKSTLSIVDKLRRERTRLATMQDLVGARLVLRPGEGLEDQDRVVGTILSAVSGETKTVDRRSDPRYGYRAVHVILTMGHLNMEIQVRTHLQHLWAEVMEKGADKLGRELRYTEPAGLSSGIPRTFSEVMMSISDAIASVEFLQIAIRKRELALDAIAAISDDEHEEVHVLRDEIRSDKQRILDHESNLRHLLQTLKDDVE